MYRPLAMARLTSGEAIELGVIEAPEPAWADRLVPFLSHKGGDYGFHVRTALAQPLDELQTRFYVAVVDERPLAHAMVVGARGIGILAHVYTLPTWRQRGAIRLLLAELLADVRALGYRVVTLVTGFDTVPFRIYRSLGFEPIVAGDGNMRWLAKPGADAALLAPAETAVRPTRWDDWAAYSFATTRPVSPLEPLPRSPAVGITGHGTAEWGFLALHRSLEPGRGDVSRVLVSETGAVVGWCHVVPGPAVLGGAWLLDLHALPAFASRLPDLLADLVWPPAPVVFHATAEAEAHVACLRESGFAPVARLPRIVDRDDRRQDLHVWLRTP